jgi:hypothetical protein
MKSRQWVVTVMALFGVACSSGGSDDAAGGASPGGAPSGGSSGLAGANTTGGAPGAAGSTSCPAGINAEPSCNECMQQSCCAELTACNDAGCSLQCVPNDSCSAATKPSATAALGCLIAHCESSCPSAPGTQLCSPKCDTGSICVPSLNGARCLPKCTTSSQCPSTVPCCVFTADGQSYCDGADSSHECRCTSGSECSTGACAPFTDIIGTPSGPYVCVANDGQAYHGCSGLLTSCGAGYCCFTDGKQNQFCSKPCASSTECGAGAACNPYSNENTTCAETLGCGPA